MLAKYYSTNMTKYLNPFKYLKFLNKKINQHKIKKLEKKINNIKYLSKKLKNISTVDKLLEFHFNTFSSNEQLIKKCSKYCWISDREVV